MTMINKEKLNEMIDQIIELEGEYSDDKDDLGGKTKYGITEITANRLGYKIPIKELSKKEAKNIYRKIYWELVGLDRIYYHAPDLAFVLFNIGINVGPQRAVYWLQRSLNIFNDIQLNKDGHIGILTENSLSLFLDNRKEEGEKVLIKTINGLQTSHYINITEKREKNRKFIYGWISKRVICQI